MKIEPHLTVEEVKEKLHTADTNLASTAQERVW
jgi:hypothetical protein